MSLMDEVELPRQPLASLIAGFALQPMHGRNGELLGMPVTIARSPGSTIPVTMPEGALGVDRRAS
jgi:hypothetical protein